MEWTMRYFIILWILAGLLGYFVIAPMLKYSLHWHIKRVIIEEGCPQ